MAVLKRRGGLLRGSVVYLPVEEISPNPAQPRRNFHREGINELADSIRQFGIINPLSVRLRGDRYELIAGERRLRAAKLAGLREVPCIIMDVNMEESSLLALVENLQRRDLDFIEEAEGISQLIRIFGMSQEEVARRLGKSQSAVANKLRLLKLPADVLERLRDAGLGERHGRALLRLKGAEEQRAALNYIIEHGLNVAATESYIDSLLAAPEPIEGRKSNQKTMFVLKDVRVFLNTLFHGINLMKQGGIDAQIDKKETENELILTINIPKRR
ncbi:MAG TPA: ParB/RepB/Spo0J family partition protein [Clostridiales bacterium]|nr:ParB/RepB/Spo0J family partition protein [Clostridiales bacterium]